MNLQKFLILFFSALSAFAEPDTDKFKSYWYDGNAEISTYVLSESRYNEMRDGKRVMVFVTEPLRLSTMIKPDIKLPEDSMIRVIKLNDTREFVTGIYNYSVMTSVFMAVEDKSVFKNGDALKISFTGQEWCGTVFDRMIRSSNSYQGVLFSYFESEGEKRYTVDFKDDIIPEENLWLTVRELTGIRMKEGEDKTIQIIPSVWQRRKTHTAAKSVQAVLKKGSDTLCVTPAGKIKASAFYWAYGDKKTEVLVEAQYPRRIVSFTEPDGTHGKLLASIRTPYWKKNKNADLPLRKDLKLNVTP
jgi:hypothetical protein